MQKLSFTLVFLIQLVSVCVCWSRGPPSSTDTRRVCVVPVIRGGCLCVKLLGWGLLIGCAGGFSLSEVVAALILLPHAVDQEEDEEDGEQEANNAAGNNSCGRNRKRSISITQWPPHAFVDPNSSHANHAVAAFQRRSRELRSRSQGQR